MNRARCFTLIHAVLLASVAWDVSWANAQPTPPVRVIAEWEPAVGTLISWPLGIPQQLVVELAEDDKLFVLVTGQGAENQARATLNSWGVDPTHVQYIHCDVQTHWPRDWGPHQVFDGDGQWGIVDPVFEGYPWVPVECAPITSPGGYEGDDSVPIDVATHFNAPLHTLPAYLTGGNILVDGHRTAFSTCAMVGENQQLWTEDQFLALAAEHLGLDDFVILDNTEDYGIQHIDCWLKVLDEETLLVKRPPTWHPEYDRIEDNLDLIEELETCYGRPFRIIRIDCPPYDGGDIAAYTNSLILNRKILVPLFNIPGDAEALETYAEAMPGYEIIGIPWNGWYYYDALHCRTRAIFDRDMLRMTHRRMDAAVDFAVEHLVTATIDDRSEAGLIADELRVHHRLAGEFEWSWALLTPTGEPDTYEGVIPGAPEGATIEYYIAAADLSGRAETLPRTAPDGFYSFSIIDAGLAIEVPAPPALLPPGEAVTFEVLIDPGDESIEPGSELLNYRHDDGAFETASMTSLGDGLYEATLPAVGCDDAPEFYVSAIGSDSGMKTVPADAPASVFVAEVGALVETPLLIERFEAGLPDNWSGSGLWHATGSCLVDPPCDGASWMYFGLDGACDYDTGAPNVGTLTSPTLDLPAVTQHGSITLQYCHNLETESDPEYDIPTVLVNAAVIDQPADADVWQMQSIDLTAFAGETVTIEWSFDTVDEYYNDQRGWQIDLVTIISTTIECMDVCPGDLDGDAIVGVTDLLALLGDWGAAGPADLDGDGFVDVEDMLLLLAAWGPC